MKYWLIKSEPSAWSWDEQVKAGVKGTPWTGVRNHLAKQNLRAMQKGDRCFFYHSGEGKEIVGLCEVIRPAYPDPTDESGAFVAVDVRALEPLKHPISLKAIKSEQRLKNMAFVRSARLSVQPVSTEEWKLICKMGGV